jgi:hypothetical protein
MKPRCPVLGDNLKLLVLAQGVQQVSLVPDEGAVEDFVAAAQ